MLTVATGSATRGREMVDARKALACQQACGTGTADLAGTVHNDRALTVQSPVFIAQGINRDIEGTGKTIAPGICRRADIKQLTAARQQVFSALGRQHSGHGATHTLDGETHCLPPGFTSCLIVDSLPLDMMQPLMMHFLTNTTIAIANTTKAVIVKLSMYMAHLRFMS